MTTLPSDYQDKMTEMVSNNNVAADSAGESADQIQTQMDAIQEEIDTISDYVNTKIANDLEEYLIGTTYSTSTHIMSQGPLFNKSSEELGNLTDWSVLTLSFDNDSSSANHFTIVSPSILKCLGNKISLFTQCPTGGYDMAIAKRVSGEFTSVTYCNITSAIFDSTSGYTFVTLSGSYLSDQKLCFTLKAYYNSPVNSTINKYVSDWEIGHDYIIADIDSSHAYGLKAKKSMLGNAKTLMVNNQTKFSNSASTWGNY